MIAKWQPYSEPLRSVVLRNGTIAVVLGAVLAGISGGWARWPLALAATACCIIGLLVERWLFFAEARHTVRLYHGDLRT